MRENGDEGRRGFGKPLELPAGNHCMCLMKTSGAEGRQRQGYEGKRDKKDRHEGRLSSGADKVIWIQPPRSGERCGTGLHIILLPERGFSVVLLREPRLGGGYGRGKCCPSLPAAAAWAMGGGGGCAILLRVCWILEPAISCGTCAATTKENFHNPC